MTPLYLTLHQNGAAIAVNMNQVCWMYPNAPSLPNDKTVLIFGFVLNDEPAYIIVDESIEFIRSHQGWTK
jgi:hypothetical protein